MGQQMAGLLMNANYYVVSGFQVAFSCLSGGSLYTVCPCARRNERENASRVVFSGCHFVVAGLLSGRPTGLRTSSPIRSDSLIGRPVGKGKNKARLLLAPLLEVEITVTNIRSRRNFCKYELLNFLLREK